MQNVKSIFFLTAAEAKLKQVELDDPYIDYQMPHFEMDDGSIVWGKFGFPAHSEKWFGVAGDSGGRLKI